MLGDGLCDRKKSSRSVIGECTETNREPLSMQIVPMLGERGVQQGECPVKLIGGG